MVHTLSNIHHNNLHLCQEIRISIFSANGAGRGARPLKRGRPAAPHRPETGHLPFTEGKYQIRDALPIPCVHRVLQDSTSNCTNIHILTPNLKKNYSTASKYEFQRHPYNPHAFSTKINHENRTSSISTTYCLNASHLN